MQTFTHLPLGMPGQVYRSAMPYSYVYDINAENISGLSKTPDFYSGRADE